MGNPFTSLSCTIRYDNARVLSWTMTPGLTLPEKYVIQVENSRTGAPWEVIAMNVAGTCVFVDSRKRNYNKHLNDCYRLRLILPCNNKEQYVSPIVDAGNYKAYPYSADAENVIKQASTEIEISGCKGVLMKRMTWGVRCPLCVDFAGQGTVNEHCPRCLGTGMDGGYFPGIPLEIIKDGISINAAPTQIGYQQGEVVKGRCIAYPWIAPGDVWCEDGTNSRFVIQAATPAASYKQTTLIYSLQMNKVEFNDVLHSVHANDLVNRAGDWESKKLPGLMPDDTRLLRRPNAWDSLLQEP